MKKEFYGGNVFVDDMVITPLLAAEAHMEDKYIATHSGIFQVLYSVAQKAFYPLKVSSADFVKPGRIEFMTAKEVNEALGYQCLAE